ELLPEFRGTGFGDLVDNDCDGVVDDLIATSGNIVLRREAFHAFDVSDSDRKRHEHDDDDDSSASRSQRECHAESLTVSVENTGHIDVADVVIRGQLTLARGGSLTDYIFGDLTTFGVKVDKSSLRVAWVQFSLAAGQKRRVSFPLCVR